MRHLRPQLVVELRELCARRGAVGQELERDRAIEREVIGAIHFSDAAPAEERDEPGPAGDDRAGREMERRGLRAARGVDEESGATVTPRSEAIVRSSPAR